MSEGIFVRTFPLKDYPPKSQELMNRIFTDFEKIGLNVKKYKGSYSIAGTNDSITAVKVICTIGSKFETPGTGVLVLFRKELVKLIGMEKIRNKYNKLDIKNTLLEVGGGVYRDFYITVVDSYETYLAKKDQLIDSIKEILPLKTY